MMAVACKHPPPPTHTHTQCTVSICMTICVHLYNFAHFRKKIAFNRNCGICRGKSFNHIFAFPVSVLVTLWLSSQATVYTCVICKLICHCLHFRHPYIWFGPAFHRLQFKNKKNSGLWVPEPNSIYQIFSSWHSPHAPLHCDRKE